MWVASCCLFIFILIRWRKLFSLQMVIAKCPPPRNLFRSAQHDTTNDPPRSSSGRSLVGWLCSLDLSRRLRNDKTLCWGCFIGFLQQKRNIKKWNWHLASINETLWPRARRRQRRCKSRARFSRDVIAILFSIFIGKVNYKPVVCIICHSPA